MRNFNVMLFAACISCTSITYAQWKDPSPHRIRFVQVKPDVRLEVLDWGGRGKPLLFLTGLGDSAHMFDEFAPRFTDSFRVYGLTRRGYGGSSQPTTGYDISTLVSDIVSVIDSLKLKRVTLIGHSLAGDELTKLAATYPDRVEKLIYLDAAHDRTEVMEIFKDFPQPPPMTKADSASISAVREYWARSDGILLPEAEMRAMYTFYTDGGLKQQVTPDSIITAILKGVEHPRYSNVRARALAFYAFYASAEDMKKTYPSINRLGSIDQAKADELCQKIMEWGRTERERFRHEMKNGRVIELHGAHHYVYLSHPEEVEKEMRAFLLDK